MTSMAPSSHGEGQLIKVRAGPVALEGDLGIPGDVTGIVLFAHGSGSSRHSPRNRFVASFLRKDRLSTFLIDLLTTAEESADAATGHLRFDIDLLGDRLIAITDWLPSYPATSHLPVDYFGASTGVAAALVAAAHRPGAVHAVVSRGVARISPGRPSPR